MSQEIILPTNTALPHLRLHNRPTLRRPLYKCITSANRKTTIGRPQKQDDAAAAADDDDDDDEEAEKEAVAESTASPNEETAFCTVLWEDDRGPRSSFLEGALYKFPNE